MFDCPEQTQTSPTSTFVSAMVLDSAFDDTLNVRDSAEAGMASNSSFHAPFALAFVVLRCPAKSTANSSPAADQPEIRTGISRCSTMSEQKINGNRSSEAACEVSPNKPKQTQSANRTDCFVISSTAWRNRNQRFPLTFVLSHGGERKLCGLRGREYLLSPCGRGQGDGCRPKSSRADQLRKGSCIDDFMIGLLSGSPSFQTGSHGIPSDFLELDVVEPRCSGTKL